MAAPEKPYRRISIALAAARSRTVSQKGWSNRSTGSVSLPS
jgi:hypothetical protein